jgi:hypothetical protein
VESPKSHATANDIVQPLVINSTEFTGKPYEEAYLKA